MKLQINLMNYKKLSPKHQAIPHLNHQEFQLSHTQKRIWFFEKLVPLTPTYNMCYALELSAPLQQTTLIEALNLISREQIMLRAYLSIDDTGQPLQKITPEIKPEILIFSQQSDQESLKFLKDQSRKPFNLALAPLWRTTLLTAPKNNYLLFTFHHLIADGWSLSIFFAELSRHYNALNQKKTSQCKKSLPNYLDYIAWQNKLLQGTYLDQQFSFWHKHLKANQTPITLPLDFSRKKIPTYSGKRCFFNIPQASFLMVKTIAQTNKCTLYHALLSIFMVLLYKLTHKTNMDIGTPIANRQKLELHSMIGFLANTMLIQKDINPKITFVQLMQEVKKLCFSCLQNQDIPFEHLVKLINPEHDLSGSPLFNIVFVLQNTPPIVPSFENITTQHLPIDNLTAKFDLVFTAVNDGQMLKCAFEYATDLFTETSIKQYTTLFQSLILAISQRPEKLIKDYSLYPSNCPPEPYKEIHWPKESLCDLFEKVVSQYPEATALCQEGVTMSYQELNERANQVAQQLIYSGVTQNQLVGLAANPSTDLIIGLIGILKASAAYVPIDLDAPEKRNKLIIINASLKTLVSTKKHRVFLEQLAPHVNYIYVDNLENKTTSETFKVKIKPNNLCYIIYTSGSTGTPKGVMVEHQNVARLFSSSRALFNFSKHDKIGLLHSYAFDFSVWEIWSALLYGGQLVIIPNKTRKNLEQLCDLIKKEQITILNQTPEAFQQLTQIDCHCDEKKFNSLRHIIFGGAALLPKHISLWTEKYGLNQPELTNMFGITETTVHVTHHKITPQDLLKSACPIGLPLDDLQIYLLDENLNIVPPGVVGMMYVGGPGVTRGYLNNTALTQSAFITCPWRPKERLYKSGDLARRHTHGHYEYVGRSDEQIKIRGFRIEIGEITTIIESEPYIKQCLILPIDKKNGATDHLVAYCLLNSTYFSQTCPNELVSDWETIFDDYYSQSNPTDNKAFNINGWYESFNRDKIPENQMLDWVENTVKLILSLYPKNVLEIGFGTGMLLARIAPNVTTYYGTDLSQKAVEYVQENLLDSTPNLSHVSIHQKSAEETLALNQRYDTVIINSVCQYFPNIHYLENLIVALLNNIEEESTLFIGDVRNYAIDDLFHEQVVLHQAPNDARVIELNHQAKLHAQKDYELRIHPEYFTELVIKHPEISSVQICYKQGKHPNELNLFRYDVILFIKHSQQTLAITSKTSLPNDIVKLNLTFKNPIVYENSKHNQLDAFRSIQLQLQQKNALLTKNDLPINDTLFKQDLTTYNACSLLSTLQCVIRLMPASNNDPTYFNVVLMSPKDTKKSLQMKHPKSTLPHLYSEPLLQKEINQWPNLLANKLAASLPGHMIPRAFLEMEQIPLTINGKVDTPLLPRLQSYKPSSNKHNNEALTTETEQKIASAFTNLLSINCVKKGDDFFKLGGHSLLATKLIFQLQKAFNRKLPLRLILLHPTIEKLAFSIDQYLDHKNLTVLANEQIDEAAATQLPNEINPKRCRQNQSTEETILLTGATGFVGCFLLHQLLHQKPRSILYCLVRSSNVKEAKARLLSQLAYYELILTKEQTERIKIVIGDLAQKKCGLNSTQWCFLSKTITSVFHNGAVVNFVTPYHQLEKENVQSTLELLKLCCTKYAKAFHFISSLFVFPHASSTFNESNMPQNLNQLKLGYLQSKWVCEHLVKKAEKKGVTTKIYRLGRISGCSQTGACQTNDLLWKSVQISLRQKCLPESNAVIDITPVDIATMAIVRLSESSIKNTLFHIRNPNVAPFSLLQTKLKQFGYQFTVESYDHWHQGLVNSLQKKEDTSILQILPALDQLNDTSATSKAIYDCKLTCRLLSSLSITCPSVADLLDRYIDYFIKTNYLPKTQLTKTKEDDLI
jgi:amino acid adenylation domain-containing protein/thioester reductase-like protein